MALLSDFGRFLLSILKHWQAYITGSLFTAAAFLYEHLSGKMISANVVSWGAGAFFIAGAFITWRDEYKSTRAIDIRDRLDGFVESGEALISLWRKRKHPRIRSKHWNRSVVRFVRQHFDMTAVDEFESHILGVSEAIHIGLGLAPTPGTSSQAYDTAMLLGTRVEALKELREKIQD